MSQLRTQFPRKVSVLVLIVLVLSGCDVLRSGPKPAPEFAGSVKIGVAAPFTGDTADGGLQILQGAELAASDANEAGGVLGKKIEIVAVDDGANPAKGPDVARKLIADGIVAVVGHKDSGVSIPASSVYHAAGILQITPTSSNPKLTSQGFNTVFRVCPIDTSQGPFLADFVIRALGKKRLAVLYANTAYGEGLQTEFERRARELTAEIVASIQIKRGDKDFAGVLGQVKATSPDAVFYAGSLPEAIIIKAQMKEAEIPQPFIGGDTLFQPDFIVQAGSASEGSYLSSFFPNVVQESENTFKDWVSRYREGFKRNPGGNSSGGYVAAQAVIEAIKHANSLDPGAIRVKLQALDMKSLIGRIAFDAKGDLQDQQAHLRIFKVQNGTFVEVPSATK